MTGFCLFYFIYIMIFLKLKEDPLKILIEKDPEYLVKKHIDNVIGMVINKIEHDAKIFVSHLSYSFWILQ